MTISTKLSGQTEREALQAEMRETTARLERVYAHLQSLIARQVQIGRVQEV